MSAEETTQSGVAWIGEVPRRWSVCALTYRYEVQLGKMLDAKRITGDHLAPYLRNTDVQWGSINIDSLPQMDFDADDRLKYQLRTGDILVCEGGEVGRAAVWRSSAECYYQKALHRLRPYDEKDFPPFLVYALRCAVERGAFATAEKSTIAHLPADALRQHRFPFPPLDEQIAIASYLDAETARIDGLISDKEALIETLRELRRVTVAEAITRGVRGERPMRPSGLSWVNEIPADWQTLSLKRFVRLSGGHTPSTGNPAFWNGSVPWFSPKDMKSDELQDSIDHVTDLAVSESGLQIIEPGTTMIVVRGMILAHTFPVCVAQVTATINQDMKALVPDEGVHRMFLPWLLRGGSALFLSLTEQSAHGTMALRTDRFMGEKLPVPPLDEQIEIVKHLEAERRRIDLLLLQISEEIGLLRELRSATIADAILGRIDVRSHMKS